METVNGQATTRKMIAKSNGQAQTGPRSVPTDLGLAADALIMRPVTMVDLEQACSLFNAASLATTGQHETTPQRLKTEWELPEFDLASATQAVFTHQRQMVGYVEVWDVKSPPVKIWVWGCVHPEYEGLGIGSGLMSWAETRARQALARVPKGLQMTMESSAVSHHQPAHDLFRALGMNPIRQFLTMAIDLDQQPAEARWPKGISVRTMGDMSELEAIVHAVRAAFKDHWGFVERPFDEDYQHWKHFVSNDEDFDPELWFLALDDDQIAGVCLGWPKSDEDPEMGWVSTLGVLRPWRRKGLGLALLQHSFAEFYRRGKARVGLGVDGSSLTGATRLYEKAGMRQIRKYDLYAKQLRAGKVISTTKVS